VPLWNRQAACWHSLSACALLLAGIAWAANPADFAKADLDDALAARKLKTRIQTELSLDPPETFRIEIYKTGARVTGGDLRGLMYGLIEAAEQIRSTGKLKAVRGVPALAVRGVRMEPGLPDLQNPDFFAEPGWRTYFETLARSRMNRFSLVLPLESARADALGALSQLANDYGVDFTLGLRAPLGDPGDLYVTLRKLLEDCPLIRGIEIDEGDQPLEFYQDSVFAALRESGHRVTLDLHGAASRNDLTRAALEAGVPLRVAHAAGLHGSGYELHWELHEGPSGADAERVRQRTEQLVSEGAAGFEIDAPGPSAEDHREFYRLWGWLGYDPKALAGAK
jgi:hypothetical protein